MNTYEQTLTFFTDNPEQKYTGYIWMVESSKPHPLDDEKLKIDKLNTTNNSFNKIQEAYLVTGNEKDKTSVHIKNIDGDERVFILKHSDFDNDKFKKEDVFFPQKGEGKLHFIQVYELKESLISEGYKTWMPVVKLFNGFKKQQKNA